MIDLRKDKKSTTYIITTMDKEGFHRQLNITRAEMVSLKELIQNELDEEFRNMLASV